LDYSTKQLHPKVAFGVFRISPQKIPITTTQNKKLNIYFYLIFRNDTMEKTGLQKGLNAINEYINKQLNVKNYDYTTRKSKKF
jgi:hypothetical protein